MPITRDALKLALGAQLYHFKEFLSAELPKHPYLAKRPDLIDLYEHRKDGLTTFADVTDFLFEELDFDDHLEYLLIYLDQSYPEG